MTLSAAIQAELPLLRAEAEAAFTDTYAAYSPGGRTTNADGMEVEGYTSEGSTPAKVQSRARQGDANVRIVRVGGVDRQVIEAGLHIPVSKFVDPVTNKPQIKAGDIGVGWEYECTAIGPNSSSWVGRRFLVVEVPSKTYATARRLDVVELP